MTTVYVLMDCPMYEPGEVVGVFSALDLAQAHALARTRDQHPHSRAPLQWTQPNGPEGGWGCIGPAAPDWWIQVETVDVP